MAPEETRAISRSKAMNACNVECTEQCTDTDAQIVVMGTGADRSPKRVRQSRCTDPPAKGGSRLDPRGGVRNSPGSVYK